MRSIRQAINKEMKTFGKLQMEIWIFKQRNFLKFTFFLPTIKILIY